MPTVFTVRRPVIVLLLVIATAAIAFITIGTAGRSYVKMDPIPFEDLRHLARRIEHRPIATETLAVIVVPIAGNVLLFVPWGVLMFLTLYTLDRPTLQTYVLTLLLGFSFSAAVEAWQYFLPSRVADVNDVIWNTVGTGLGALLGHLRARVRIEFA